MSKKHTLQDMNERTTVSNNSPQSPTGRTLLEPITLDFDPMSFEFKEESPLTSPFDNTCDLDETISPSQNIDVVDFFDPFCPVKEESPTDYYPNVMMGQAPMDELLEGLSEPQQFSTSDEPQIDNFSNPHFSMLGEPLIDNLTEPYQDDSLNEPFPGDISNDFCQYSEPEFARIDSSKEETQDYIEYDKPNELSFSCTNPELKISNSNAESFEESECLTESEQTQAEMSVSHVDQQAFDYSEHDFNSQHDESQISEEDIYQGGRTSSSSISNSDTKLLHQTSESSSKENKKVGSKSISSKKEKTSVSKEVVTTKKGEQNGYASHNGIDGTVTLKNTKNTEKNLQDEKLDNLASVTDLKTSFTKNTSDLQDNDVQEVKPSVDRVKVQRTFSQTFQDELCLCKICDKHVYQMEKMKAERSVFHKNCFRCKECNKLLNVDSYQSNEGDIYCKPHFRQLFQPKARFDGEDAAPNEQLCAEGKQRYNEMIIRENIPVELPPDVLRADSKPDHGLDNIPVNLRNIKSKFEEYREEHHLPSTTDVCTLQRSASVMARLAKYQSAVSGGDDENGELSESDDDEVGEDPSVIKPSKHKEKVVFSGMSSLKSQWETGTVTASKEEKIEEKKEELNKLRQRICLGRSESMKAVYEKACQDTSKQTAVRTDSVDLGHEVKATRLKEKFEKGELVNELEEENLERVRKEKEEDFSVFTEPGIANDAKRLFKEIDATAKTTPKMLNKSPTVQRQIGIQSPVNDADVVKCSEPTEKEEIPVDTTDVSQRFKFFENYSDSPKERKRFQITPPREPAKETTPDKEIKIDPNIIRASDTIEDMPTTDTARRMLDKFKALEKETPAIPSGPKPLKRITPPREYIKADEGHEFSPDPERDPSIIHSSYKADDDIIVEADKAKSLKAKFENWDTELSDNKRNEENEEENFLPQVDTTKTLRAKFEAIKEDKLKPTEKPKSKVNRFV